MCKIYAKGKQHDFEFIFCCQRDRLVNFTFLREGLAKLELNDFKALEKLHHAYLASKMYR